MISTEGSTQGAEQIKRERQGDPGLPARTTSWGEVWMIARAKTRNDWDTAQSRVGLSTGQLLT